MPLDFSALQSQTTVNALVAEYQRLSTELATLPVADVSDQGRSISSTASRNALIEAMSNIRKQLVVLAGPAFKTSRMRA